jgi:hypothetical protein
VTEPSRIDADLDGVRLSPDSSRLILLLRDMTGQKVSVSLPTSCLNTVFAAAPSPVEIGTVQSVDAWNMAPAGNGQDMVLTLCTPEGKAISFRIKSWQAEGIATVATYGSTRGRTGRSIH